MATVLLFECYCDISGIGKYAKKMQEGLLVGFFFFLLGVRQCNSQSIQNRVLPVGLKKKSINIVLWHLFCYQNYFYNIAFRKIFYPV